MASLALVACLRPAPCATVEPIVWDAATRRLVQPGAGYARMARLADDRLIIIYERGGRVWLRHSGDAGARWDEPVPVMAMPGSQVANPELVVLRDGRLLALGNERPDANASGPPRPFRILVCRSADGGRTWTAPVAVFTGGTRFQDGCWEPAAIQLSSGDIHLYFANEAPFPQSNEQEISLLRSTDGGLTWSAAERVSFRPRHRDGMPVPLLLADGRTIALAIEDDGLAGTFKPVIIATSDAWRSRPMLGDGPGRWSALANPLPAAVYAGAPYLCRLPDGRTLLSCQEGVDGTMASSRMTVRIGDRQARNFASPSHPFPDQRPQLWNALFVKNATTVTAITTATIDGRQGIWTVDGTVAAP